MAEKRVLYSGVVLDAKSVHSLVTKFSNSAPWKWKVLAHHMTICLGELPAILKDSVGEIVELKVLSIGTSDKVVAFGVDGFYSDNQKPHITFAIDHANGAKPKESNDITDWKELDFPFTVTGVITEVTN